MDIEVVLGNEEELEEASRDTPTDPDEYFINSAFRMVYQTNNFLLPQIRDLIDRGVVLNLRPEYQRRLRWTNTQKSKLIESLLLNIPIPPVFLYESEEARYEVMDGQQRLNAVHGYVNGEYGLSGLPILKPLNGLRYSECPPRIKRALDRASLSAIVLLLESENTERDSRVLTLSEIRRFIFDRLNTGGTKLNSQEIRNALNPGVFNKTLIEITRYPLFTKVFDIPPYVEKNPSDYYESKERQNNRLYSSMGDCQLVLRFFALKNEENIRGSMKSMLDRAMQVQFTEDEGRTWNQSYQERFEFLYHLFDGQPFRLPPDEKGRERLSAAIYDASMVAIDRLWEQKEAIQADKPDVKKRMNVATNNEEHLIILTGQRNTANAVRERIGLLHQILLPS